MPDAVSTLLLQVREVVIDSSTTNPSLADSDYVSLMVPPYRVLSARDGPYVQSLAGNQTNWNIAGGGGTDAGASSSSNWRRILAVYSTGLSQSATRGARLEYVSRAEYDLERSLDPFTQGTARLGHWYKHPNQTWQLIVHPGTAANAENFAADVELEQTDLQDPTSVVLLSQAASAELVAMTALAACGPLRRGQEVVNPIMASIPDRKALSDWLSAEEQRGNAFAASLAQRLK